MRAAWSKLGSLCLGTSVLALGCGASAGAEKPSNTAGTSSSTGGSGCEQRRQRRRRHVDGRWPELERGSERRQQRFRQPKRRSQQRQRWGCGWRWRQRWRRRRQYRQRFCVSGRAVRRAGICGRDAQARRRRAAARRVQQQQQRLHEYRRRRLDRRCALRLGDQSQGHPPACAHLENHRRRQGQHLGARFRVEWLGDERRRRAVRSPPQRRLGGQAEPDQRGRDAAREHVHGHAVRLAQ